MDRMVEQLAYRDGRYNPKAFMFVLRALRSATPERKHISGAALSHAVLTMAKQVFGVTAWLVLNEWGLRTTRDIGEIIYLLAENEVVRTSPDDSIEDFDNVFDLKKELEESYPWSDG